MPPTVQTQLVLTWLTQASEAVIRLENPEEYDEAKHAAAGHDL